MSEPDPNDPEARRIPWSASGWHIAPAVIALLPVLAFGWLAIASVRRSPMLGGDQAMLELWTRSALHGKALLGPYSRFGWNHPGPAVFYWFAPFYLLSGQRPEGLGLASLVILVAGLSYVCILVGRLLGRAGAWTAAGVTLAFLFATGTDWFDETWNPVVIVAPMIVLGVACAGVVAGRRWCLVVAVVSASFCIQTHVGTLPVAGVLAAMAAVACVVRLRRSREGWLKPVLAAVIAGVGVWLLPLYQQFTRNPGNLGEIARSNLRNAGAHHSLRAVFDTTVAQFTLTGHGLMGEVLARLHTTPPGAGGLRLALFIAVVVAAVACAVRSARTGRLFEAGLSGGGAAAALVFMIALTRVQGQLEGYLTISAMSVGFLMYLGIALTAVAELRRFERPHLDMTVACLVTTVALVLSVMAVTRSAPDAVYARRASDNGAEQTFAGLAAWIPPRTRAVVIEIDDPNVWPVAALVANQLEKLGMRTAEQPEWLHVFGRQRTIDGCESVLVRVVVPSAAPDPSMNALGQIDLGQIRARRLDPPQRCAR